MLRLLGQEIERLGQRLETPKCPIELRPAQDHQADLEQQLADVKAKIDKAAENLMLADDRTRPIIDGKLKALWAEHDRLAAELNATRADAEEQEYETTAVDTGLVANDGPQAIGQGARAGQRRQTRQSLPPCRQRGTTQPWL